VRLFGGGCSWGQPAVKGIAFCSEDRGHFAHLYDLAFAARCF